MADRKGRETVAQFEGRMVELIFPQHEFSWNGRGRVKFDNGIIVHGNLQTFDRFLIFCIEYNPSTGEFIQWYHIPKTPPFTSGLYAEMLLFYDTDRNFLENDDSENAMWHAFDVLGGVMLPSGEYDKDSVGLLAYTQRYINPNTVYFYLEYYLVISRVYPDNLSKIRQLTLKERQNIFNACNDDLPALCYKSSKQLPYNPLGTLSAIAMYWLLRNRGQFHAQAVKHQRIATLYQKKIVKHWFPRKSHNTCKLCPPRLLASLKNNKKLYEELFVTREVLKLMQRPSKFGAQDEQTYIVERHHYQTAYQIKYYLQRLDQEKNPMPPTKTRRLQLGLAAVDGEDDDNDDYRHDETHPLYWSTPLPIKDGAKLSGEQRQTLWKTNAYNILLVTGGPGTGKTSMVLKNIYFQRPKEYIIATNTGKAADRIIGVLNCPEAKVVTLKYIEVLLKTNPDNFMRYTTGLIIDEASCVDEGTLARTLKALPYLQQLVMIGDVNQISPIDPGFPFHDMITVYKSKGCVIQLTKNFRSSDDVHVHNAKCILNYSSDFSNISFTRQLSMNHNDPVVITVQGQDTYTDIINVIETIKAKHNNYYAQHEVQFITPFRKDSSQLCQMGYNYWFRKDNPTLFHLHVNQRVIFLENFLESTVHGKLSDSVKNGESGIILKIYDKEVIKEVNAEEDVIIVENNNNKKRKQKKNKRKPIEVMLPHTHDQPSPKRGFRRWIVIQTSYGMTKNIDLISIKRRVMDGSCITAHKSQGSEYRTIVLVLPYHYKGISYILNCNLLYTMYTRVKDSLIILYKKQKVCNAFCDKRATTLGSFANIATTPRAPYETILWHLL